MSDENVLISEIIDNTFDNISAEIGPTGPQNYVICYTHWNF